jgi:ectoine hydroxylase-related dioxygenase (phytanoyl-CoA dioxygenase family)
MRADTKMTNYQSLLTEGEGYKILPGFIPSKLISSFLSRIKDLYPVRASSSNKIYAEGEKIKELPDISVWWSQIVSEFPESIAILKLVQPVIQSHFPNFVHYTNDVVFIKSKSTWVSPHVDSPHRFEKYNYDKRLLGIQCIISLKDLDKNSASTGLVPYSQKRDFEINKCYTGSYDRWFLENCIQPDLPRGSLLLYNCRLLHSSMPNPTELERPALLYNFLHKSIVDEIKEIDSVWTSNAKNS